MQTLISYQSIIINNLFSVKNKKGGGLTLCGDKYSLDSIQKKNVFIPLKF